MCSLVPRSGSASERINKNCQKKFGAYLVNVSATTLIINIMSVLIITLLRRQYSSGCKGKSSVDKHGIRIYALLVLINNI